jgi:hypothetical protein
MITFPFLLLESVSAYWEANNKHDQDDSGKNTNYHHDHKCQSNCKMKQNGIESTSQLGV